MPEDPTPLAQRLVQVADDAMFDPQGVRGHLGAPLGRARAAVVAVLRELAESVTANAPRMGVPVGRHADAVLARAGVDEWLTVLADSIEKGEG